MGASMLVTMTTDQIQILVILGATVGVFLWGRFRHDLVAIACLLACVFAGLVPANEAFSGFGHPAVVTVACVLILSWGLQQTGVVDVLTHRILPSSTGPMVTIAALTGLGALLSAFMNNVGAMALLMPVAIQISGRLELPPGKVLMPLSFGTILGGMTTLIGTPPNLIVSGFRAETGSGSFGMFDFSPVGVAVAGVGVIFVALVGWKMVPARAKAADTGFDTGTYFTEVRVTDKSVLAGKSIGEAEEDLKQADAQIIAMLRNETRISAPNAVRLVKTGDILVVEAEPESLSTLLATLGLALQDHAEEKKDQSEEGEENPATGNNESDEALLQELVVMPNSLLIGRSASDINLRTRYNLNLLAISRHGKRTIKRLRDTPLSAGDVLLLQGPPDALSGFASEFSCVPLAARSISIPDKRKALLAAGVMFLAIAGAAFGLLPAAISFTSGVLLFMLLRVMPLRKLYEAVDWPVVVLLGALIPVAIAMESTGAADLLAQTLLNNIALGRPVLALALILILAMTLSDFMNNAATAAVMCPIAISTAAELGNNTDTFLMAVAIGASCAFLTPIGHQNNTLILGPGGFRFGDYWRLGLPMEVLVVAIAVPLLLVVWPL